MSVQNRISTAVGEHGYVFAGGAEVRDLIGESGANWPGFRAHWDTLGEDRYLKGDYMFRLRRFGQVGLVPNGGKVWLRDPVAYYQSEELNRYAGGIVREFPPLTEEFVANDLFQNLLRSSFDVFGVEDEYRDAEWVADISLFRLKVERHRVTEPTPEGIHRDGVPFGVIHMVGRKDIEGGVSHVYTMDEELIDLGVLRDPLDTLYAFDNRVKHYVTPIYATTREEGWREVLVYGFSLPGTKYDKA